MANQTVSVDRNLDDAAIAGLLNGEQITINSGATLTIDSDNRWSQQAAVIGSSIIDSVTGGRLLIDGRNTWQIPFSASSGNVPSLGTQGVLDSTGGTSGAQAEFLGVWATGEVSPRAAGGAMPATGYVKFRTKTGTFIAAETVTLPGGATITAVDAGKRSWINVVCSFQGTFTVPRLGRAEVRGDWFDLGTTNGSNDQTFNVPWPDFVSAIWVETAPSSGVYRKFMNAGARWVSATATIDTDLRGTYFGQRRAQITGSVTNGSAVVTTTDTANLVVGMPINASASFANLALYITAINPGVSFTVNENANATSGSVTFTGWLTTITLAKSAAPALGYLPPSGCRVRIPNIKLSTSRSGWAGNILPTTVADRYEFVTTSSGEIVIDTADCGWFINLSAPYSVDMRRVGISIGIVLANVATTTYFEDCVVAYENGTAVTGMAMSNCYGGGTIRNCRFSRFSAAAASDNGVSMTDCSDFLIEDTVFQLGGNGSTSRLRNNADIRGLIMSRCFRFTLTRCTFIVGRLNVNGSVDVTVTDTRFADLEQGANPGSTNALTAAIDINAGAANIFIDGFTSYESIANVHPYNAIVVTATGCSGVEVRNIGVPSAPYDGGSTNPLRRVLSASVTLGLIARRVYVQNCATDFASIANTCQNVDLINCWGDGGDTQGLAGVNQLNKGCRWSNSVTGQTACYGSHWEDAFISTTAGRIVIKANEPTADTTSQCAVTAGTPKFTSTGNVAMPTVGDQVEWTMPYFALGITALQNTAPTVTGTNTANITLEFQWDTGSGWNGVWLALTGANLSGIGAITPNTGIRLKVRATTAVANSTNALTYIRIDTTTNSTDQQIQYPLPTNATATVSFDETGSRVQVYNVTTASEIYNAIPSGTSWVYNYYNGTGISAGDVIRIRVRKPDQEDEQVVVTATATGFSATIEQFVDDHYTATTPSNVTVDYVNKKIRATGARDTFTAQELIDIIKNAEATVDGIRLLPFAEISGDVELSPGVFTALTVNLVDNWQVSWAAASVAQAFLNGGNIVGGIAGDPVEDVVGGPQVTILLAQAGTTVTVGSIAPSEAQIKEWVMEAEIIPGWSMARLLRKVGVMTIAKSSGNSPSGGTVTFRTLNDDGDEMSATVDANGNRTAVTQGS